MSTTGADSSALLPKIGLIYRLQDDSNLGFTVQRAYRSGGSAINRLTSSEYSFDPEFAWNYEVAWKGAALAGGFVYAVNLFYMDWADQQINLPQVPGDFTSDIILNAGSSKVWGGEIDLRARPNDKAQLFASVGLAKTEFTDFQFVLFGSPVDLSGMEFPQAAKLMAVIGGDYDLGGGFSVGGDLKYTSSALSRSVLEGLPEDNLPSYWVANMNLGWKRDNWSVVVYVENLLDEEYLLYRYDDPDFQLATVGRGRTYGASVSWRY
jgi:outer membrane receptor protein involved in Fe transport